MAYGFQATNGKNKVVLDDTYQAACLQSLTDLVAPRSSNGTFSVDVDPLELVVVRINKGQEILCSAQPAYGGRDEPSSWVFRLYGDDNEALYYRRISLVGIPLKSDGYGMQIYGPAPENLLIYDSGSPVVTYLGSVLNTSDIPAETTHIIPSQSRAQQRYDSGSYLDVYQSFERTSTTRLQKNYREISRTSSVRPGGSDNLRCHLLRIV